MNEKKTRVIFFLLGLTLGIILGGVAVRVYSDKIYSENSISQNVVAKLFGKVIGLIYSKDKKGNEKNSEIQTPVSTSENSSNANENSDEKITNVENENSTGADSLSSNENQNTNNDENIVVLKDKILKSQKQTIIKIIGQENKINSKDSILKKVAGVKDSKINNEITIEYWQSPLNFKGYKLGKNKLVLFGINENEPLKVYLFNSQLYLRIQEQYVKLEPNQDFKSFEKFTDATTLNILELANKTK